jgi:hypothetical protein
MKKYHPGGTHIKTIEITAKYRKSAPQTRRVRKVVIFFTVLAHL